MKKFFSVLLVGAAIQLSTMPVVEAASLNQKVESAKQKLAAATLTINVNTATASELQSLPGIGASKAAAIVAYREANGNFGSLDDLAKVKGIGTKMLAKLRGKADVK